jgi:AcrR family transcriptional regulator
VLDAVLDHPALQGDVRPSAARIAAVVGISERALFCRFRDLDALFAAAADRQVERLAPLLAPCPTHGPLADRLRAFVRQRARLLEAIRPVRRAAVRVQRVSPLLERRLAEGRGWAESELTRVFAPEIARLPSAARRDRVDALATVAEWTTWEALRTDRGLSVARATRVLATMLEVLLTGPSAVRRDLPGGQW